MSSTEDVHVTAGEDSAVDHAFAAMVLDERVVLTVTTDDGTIVSANRTAVTALGTTLVGLVGRRLADLCVDPAAPEALLTLPDEGNGHHEVAVSTPRGDRWLKATVVPVPGHEPPRAVVAAFDVTDERNRAAYLDSTLAAIERSQATIEFDLNGVVTCANPNFLTLMGYTLEEVVGQHHRMFCDPQYADSAEYRAFWQKLGRGEFDSGEYKRIGRHGKQVWIQASYNPVLDSEGRAVSVVKYALDVTANRRRAAEFESTVAAIHRAQAVAEFALDGTILDANDNFLRLTGYALDEIEGKNHRIFCDPAAVSKPEYERFWQALRRGEFAAGEYKRFGRDGREVWVQASYNPILDSEGVPVKVVEFATDVTDTKLHNAEVASRAAAVDRSTAVVEFDLDGTVLTANDNFLGLTGYRLDELRGAHHRTLVDPQEAARPEYAAFWDRLRSGHYVTGEFRRVAQGGAEIWIQASYNPVLDTEGRPVKVVKFASDVTQTKQRSTDSESRLAAIDRSTAVIEFDVDGNVLHANENFLRTTGYGLREVVGQHHSMFCTPEYLTSPEYRDFWLRLAKGEHVTGEFHRVGKFGREIWLQASYNPVLDLHGRTVRVVKYAHDVTDDVALRGRISERTREMNASVARLTASIDEIARSATDASALAQGAQSEAEQGFAALKESIEAIRLIERSSAAITEIVDVIGEIAGQTNLLAFNASIEAARAGEHGVGFSVVASEVRKLAERSSQAAHEISQLIAQSQERVGEGSMVSLKAQAAFEQIVDRVGRTSEAIRQIAASTTDQQDASHAFSELITSLGGDADPS